jgi:regulator of replication initiation timing
MENIKKTLKENKPNIADSTINSYATNLKSLFYSHNPKKVNINPAWFHNQEHILELVKQEPIVRQSNFLTALIAYNKDNKEYKDALLYLTPQLKQKKNSQDMTPKENENWKSYEEIEKIYEDMLHICDPLLKSKEPMNKEQMNKLQDFIILSLTCGYWIPPRRSEDWCKMKIKKYDTEKDNYIDFSNSKFYFNQYKTSKTYDEQEVEIPPKLKRILRRYIKLLGDNEYLLTTQKNAPLSSSYLTKLLNRIFGANISTSMLRHIYLSEKYKNVPALAEMQKTAEEMGHSITEALRYVRK